MPQYCYRCTRCFKVRTEFRTIDLRDRPTTCECGYLAERDFVAEGSCHSMNDEFHKPIMLYSIAPNTPAEKRQLQEAGATFDRETGVPLARSRSEKLRLLEATGFVETK